MSNAKFVEKLLTVLLILFVFYIIYLVAQVLTGHSPTVEEILVASTVGLILNQLRVEASLGEIRGELNILKNYLKPKR